MHEIHRTTITQNHTEKNTENDTEGRSSYDGSESKEIYMYTDGVWRDDDGITYSGGMSAEVDGSDGSVWYESPMEAE